MSSTWNDASIIATLEGWTGNVGSGATLQVYTGTSPGLDATLTGTLLVSLPFSSTPFGTPTASSGTVTATAAAITSESAVATGTAGYFAIVRSGASTPPTATQVVMCGSVGTSGADLNLSTTSITEGVTVGVSEFAVTMSQTGS